MKSLGKRKGQARGRKGRGLGCVELRARRGTARQPASSASGRWGLGKKFCARCLSFAAQLMWEASRLGGSGVGEPGPDW